MKLFKNILILSCLSLLVSACKNELKLNSPYKEIPSVYAILDPHDSVQMIRINKVFLGEGDANAMAKVSDSINYQPDEIVVSLKNSKNLQEVVFTESMVTADAGAFNKNQRVYTSTAKLRTDATYTLTIKNTHTGNVFSATATPLASVDGTASGVPLSPPYYPYSPGIDPNGPAYINYSTATSAGTKTNNIYIYPVNNAKIYKLVIRNNFMNAALGTYDYVDYIIDNPREIFKGSGADLIRARFTSADYFSAIGVALSKKNLDRSVVGRKMWLIEYFVYASTQEFIDYNEYVKPSLSLNQNKPLYSNFKDNAALGLFTFRSTLSVQKEPSTVFINSFASNSNTAPYFK